MRSLLDTPAQVGIRFRVKQLRPLNPARWGRTNAPRVLAHMVEVLESPLRVRGVAHDLNRLQTPYIVGLT